MQAYKKFLSEPVLNHLLKESKPLLNFAGLTHVGAKHHYESDAAIGFMLKLYQKIAPALEQVLKQRELDRAFIDARVEALYQFNTEQGHDYLSETYQTVLGLTDGDGRIVVGPKRADFAKADLTTKVAPIPEYLKGPHVTLFGPPDNAKMAINAMNSYHRKLSQEPKIIEEILKSNKINPKWGADDEDSKTPMRQDLASAGENLTLCFEGTLKLDEANGKSYRLANDNLAQPLKRFPGLALPCTFLFYHGTPLPLHVYDFALHFFHNWHNPKSLCFYVPKLENEEEAAYIKLLFQTAEELIQAQHAEYKLGTIRAMIVLENPRAIFRAHEIMQNLYPYFVGASLGWHDFLASTARLLKNDGNYRIPVKADPNIVIKYIKASHALLNDVVGPSGGIKIGGMYGILPINSDLNSDSFQITLLGYFKDVFTQFKRGLDGFWVAHPDFVRIGIAMLVAWQKYQAGDKTQLEQLIQALLHEKYHAEMFKFIYGQDIAGLDRDDSMYARSLIVADIKESDFISNSDPEEVRYNVFQTLQYFTDWLMGNGCVALPAHIKETPVRVMDDLATTERSRWEVWHEIHHGRISVEEFIKIAFEEYLFIRKDLSNNKKIVAIKHSEQNEKWYKLAFKLMIKLMTDKQPVEFATELLMPFTIDSLRTPTDPWSHIQSLSPEKFALDPYVDRFCYYFEMCGDVKFATQLAKNLALDLKQVESSIMSFNLEQIISAANFHGNIGESKATLDPMASAEQAKVFQSHELVRTELTRLGHEYLTKFGVKFLVSAKGKSGDELLTILKSRINNSLEQEIANAKLALFEITRKRIIEHPLDQIETNIHLICEKHHIPALSLSLTDGHGLQALTHKTDANVLFEIASLSKTLASAFALEFFQQEKISLATPVNLLFAQAGVSFRLKAIEGAPEVWGDQVLVKHLMSHLALNMHYVNGVPLTHRMPAIDEFLNGNANYQYPAIAVINAPGEKFQYSGAGFIVLEYLIEVISHQSIFELTAVFLQNLGLKHLTFQQQNQPDFSYANGVRVDGSAVEDARKMFPAFAAGAMGTPLDFHKFLQLIEASYHNPYTTGAISHDTAVRMLHGLDRGCMQFMHAHIGLGVFIVEAGANKFMLHQGANDGFRAIALHCFSGPNRGFGFVITASGELNAVLAISEISQMLLKHSHISGIDFSQFKTHFNAQNLKSEEIVNLGYKNLFLQSFERDLPEMIVDRGEHSHELAQSVLVGAKLLECTNQKFARAENLISPFKPKFDPQLFGRQGKIMDSWETVRHNELGVDSCVFELKQKSKVRYAYLSTQYHFGNHSPVVSVSGLVDNNWVELIPKTPMLGHSELKLDLGKTFTDLTHIKVLQFPDGGFTRLALYDQSAQVDFTHYQGLQNAACQVLSEKIPHVQKPLSIPIHSQQHKVKAPIAGELFNNASLALGAQIMSVSNQHYGPAIQVLSDYAPLHMFDGLESARSRVAGYQEMVEIKLVKALPIVSIEFDFKYFVNNNPRELEVLGFDGENWQTIIAKAFVKPFAGNKKIFKIEDKTAFNIIKCHLIPDGGVNRIKVYSVYA
jgi:allantoicase/malate synthase